MAATTDKFKKTGASTVTALAAPGKAIGASSITVGSTTNYPTDTGIVISIRVVDTDGNLVAGTYTEWRATVSSGTTFAIETTPVYGSDQVYAAGSTTQVSLRLSSAAHNELIDGLLVEHNQDGSHDAVTASSVAASGAISGASMTSTGTVQGSTVTATSTLTVPDKAVALAKIDGGATAGTLTTTSSGVVSSTPWTIDYSSSGAVTFSATNTKTFTPSMTGLLYVTAHTRRNSGSASDLVLSISATGTTDPKTSPSTSNGTVDAFASCTYLAGVTAGVSVTITISASGGSLSNSGYELFVIPGVANVV